MFDWYKRMKFMTQNIGMKDLLNNNSFLFDLASEPNTFFIDGD